MAGESYYAWSNFTTEDGEAVAPGDTVTQAQLGLSDEDWEALVEGGAVREEEWPILDPNFQGSPNEWTQQEAAKEAEGLPTYEEEQKAAEETPKPAPSTEQAGGN
jgi:hypothetical protein